MREHTHQEKPSCGGRFEQACGSLLLIDIGHQCSPGTRILAATPRSVQVPHQIHRLTHVSQWACSMGLPVKKPETIASRTFRTGLEPLTRPDQKRRSRFALGLACCMEHNHKDVGQRGRLRDTKSTTWIGCTESGAMPQSSKPQQQPSQGPSQA